MQKLNFANKLIFKENINKLIIIIQKNPNINMSDAQKECGIAYNAMGQIWTIARRRALKNGTE